MKFSALIFLNFIVLALSSQTLNVHISGIRSTQGNIRLAFYTTAESFDDEKALLTKTVSKAEMKNGTISVTYNGLKPGVYGIAILDDENTNQKMDYGLVLPKEGFGFSDYYHTGMSRPKFESFKFILKAEDKSVNIKLRYM